MQWHDLLSALALCLILEGMLPFVAPARYREFMQKMLGFADAGLRRIGGACLVAGVVLLYLVR